MNTIDKSDIKVGSWIKVGPKKTRKQYYHGGKLFQVTEIGNLFSDTADRDEVIYMTSESYYTHDEVKEAYEGQDEYRDKQINKLL